jgi:uncharacterized protein (DUF2062 family)
VEQLEVFWPRGAHQSLVNIKADQILRLTEDPKGAGR